MPCDHFCDDGFGSVTAPAYKKVWETHHGTPTAAPLTVCAVPVIRNGNQYITGTAQHCSTAVLRYLGSAVVLPAPLPITHASMCAACCCFFCLLRAMLCRRGSSGVSRSGALGSAVVPLTVGAQRRPRTVPFPCCCVTGYGCLAALCQKSVAAVPLRQRCVNAA